MLNQRNLLLGALLFLGVGAGTVLLTSGEGTQTPQSEPAPKVAQRASTEDAPAAPSEFRTLSPSPIPTAAKVLAGLGTGELELAERAALAETYQAEGFNGASRFMQITRRVGLGEMIDSSSTYSPIAWSANADVASDRPIKVAAEVVKLTQEFEYDEAIALAQRDLEENGPSLQVVVQWADAVLWKAMVDREAVGDDALEGAIRVLLTSVEEKVPYPLGIVSRAGGYARLSDVFLSLGDQLSSLTAAILAVLEAHSGSDLDDLGAFQRQQLCERIADLQRKLYLAGEWWPGDLTYRSVCQ